MTLIENFWQHIWRFWSVRIQAAAIFISGLMIVDPSVLLSAWNMMPAAVREVLPGSFLSTIGGALFALNFLAIMARGVKQTSLEKANADKSKQD